MQTNAQTRARTRHTPLTLLLALLLAAPAMAAGQGVVPGPVGQSPLEWLLDEREALALTPAQVARLEEIRQRLAARNDPLAERLLVMRTAWQRERMALRRAGAAQESQRLQQLRARSEPILHRIQDNNRTAMTAVHELLTRQQRLVLRELVQARRTGPGAGPGGPGAGRQGGGW
jgi:hypothetical protein